MTGLSGYVEATAHSDNSREVRQRNILSLASALLSSTFTFAWVYVVLFIAFRAVMAAVAAHFGVEPVLKLERIVYERGDLWYPHAVKNTYLVGTLFMLITAIFLIAVYQISSKGPRMYRVALLWGIIIATGMVVQRLLGVLLSDMFEFSELARLGMDIGVYASYVRMSMGERGLVAVSGVVFALLVGLFVAKPMIQTAMTKSQLRLNSDGWVFLIYQVWFPALTGLSLSAMALQPASLMPHVMFVAALVFVAMGMAIGKKVAGRVRLVRHSDIDIWMVIPVGVFFAIVMFVRLTLVEGVRL
jgi:hypothetical protein